MLKENRGKHSKPKPCKKKVVKDVVPGKPLTIDNSNFEGDSANNVCYIRKKLECDRDEDSEGEDAVDDWIGCKGCDKCYHKVCFRQKTMWDFLFCDV